MQISIIYKKPARGGEHIIQIESIHELPNSLMLITALKAVRVIDKNDIESISVSF